VTPTRWLLRARPAFVVGLLALLLSLNLCLFSDNQPSLTPLEARLVGEWYHSQPEDTRTFFPNRRFSTSNGQFVGVWRITEDRLTFTYWQTFELPHEYSLAAVAHAIRRTRQETCSWEIAFSEDGQQHILSVPGEGRPDGRWTFRRVGDE
jgi:hypothetical protein